MGRLIPAGTGLAYHRNRKRPEVLDIFEDTPAAPERIFDEVFEGEGEAAA